MDGMRATPHGRRTNAGEWRAEHRAAKKKTRTYPSEIQRSLRRLWTPHLVGQAHDFVDGEVEERARVRGLIHTDYAKPGTFRDGFRPPREPGGSSYREHVPAVHREALLDELARDRVFLRALRNEVERLAREAHLTRERRLRGDAGVGVLRQRFPSASGLWHVPSDLGFRVATVLEAKPDGFAVALRNRLVQRVSALTDEDLSLGAEDDRVPCTGGPVRILDWGCGPAGNLAVVLDAMPAERIGFEVTEVDAFGDRVPRDTAGVVGRYQCIEQLPPDTQRFDVVVFHMPPPGEAIAAHRRNIYKSDAVPDPSCTSERELPDPGRRGPAKWRKMLRRYVRQLPGLMADDGEIILLLPASVRVARGYRDDVTLVAGICEVFCNVGLSIVRSYGLVETDPVNQPYAGRNRPNWFVLVAHKEGSR